ncbi:MAG TPA: hypothetical protein VI636_20500 [Candidatus Angelobacter sp.]
MMYDLYFVQTKLRWQLFATALALAVVCGALDGFVLGRSEYAATRDVSLVVVSFLVVYQFAMVILRDWPTLPRFSKAMREGDRLYAESRVSEAITVYSELVTQAPLFASTKDRLELLVRVAIAYRDRGDVTSMVSHLEEALDLDLSRDNPTYRFALYLIAEGHFKLGHHRRAIGRFEEFISLDNRFDWKRIESLLYLHASYQEMGDFQQANTYRQETLSLMQDLPDLRIRYFEEAMLAFQ